MDTDPFTHSIYCGLLTQQSLDRIAQSLVDRGWCGRMCSWTEHELTSDDAELILMPYDPPLFSGGIRPGPDALRRVLTDLQAIHVDCDYELYDSKNQLISQGRICKLASEDRNDG